MPTLEKPVAMELREVPLPIVDIAKLDRKNWDLTLIRVSDYLNGVRTVEQISRLSKTDSNLVQEALCILQYYKCVVNVDYFMRTNRYRVTESINDYLKDRTLQNACLKYLSVEGLSSFLLLFLLLFLFLFFYFYI